MISSLGLMLTCQDSILTLWFTIVLYNSDVGLSNRSEAHESQWNMKIKEEVVKHIEAGFLEVTDYPEWLPNIVFVPQKDGKVRMLVDYKDLNEASLEDDFLLSHTDVLVDYTTSHTLFSSMDGLWGYT